MVKIFGIQLANQASLEQRATQLVLPATYYEVENAKARIGLQDETDLHIDIQECYDYQFIAPHLDRDTKLHVLNILASQLSGNTELHHACLEEMVRLKVERKEPIGTEELVDLVFNSHPKEVHLHVFNDEELGRRLVESGAYKAETELSEEARSHLDYAEIGRQTREQEHGVFMSLGYVAPNLELSPVYRCMDTYVDHRLCKQDYVFHLGMYPPPDGYSTMLDLPAPQERIDENTKDMTPEKWAQVELYSFDGAIPVDFNLTQPGCLEWLNELAGIVQHLQESGQCTKLKAVMEAEECYSVEGVIGLTEQLDDYTFAPELTTPKAVAEDMLCTLLAEADARIIMKHMDLDAYGKELLQDQVSEMTDYGLVIRPSNMELAMQKREMGGMEMG